MNKLNCKLLNATPQTMNSLRSLNLRQTLNGLRVTGNPKLIANITPNDQILCLDRRYDRTYIFIKNEYDVILLGYMQGNDFVTVNEQMFRYNKEIASVVPIGDFLVFYGQDRTCYLHYQNEGYTLLGAEPEFPVFAFSTTEHLTFAEALPYYNFVTDYPQWTGTLGIDDRKNLSALANTAYKKLKRKGKNYSSCIQPIVIRVALRLFDDTLLWDNSCYYCGKEQFCPSSLGKVTMLGNSSKFRLEPTDLSMNVWKPAVTLVKSGIGNWRNLVKAVEIYATEEQDIISDLISFRCETKQLGRPEYSLRITPICSDKHRAYREIAYTDRFRLIASVSNIDALLNGEIIADGMKPIIDNSAGDLSPQTYAILVDNEEAQKINFSTIRQTFCPNVATTVAERCFAGNIAYRLPQPPPFESLCEPMGFEKATVKWAVSVELETELGKARVSRSYGGQAWSKQLARLMTYPDRRAVRITILANANGTDYVFSAPMHPAPNGDFAIVLAPVGSEFYMEDTKTLPDITPQNTIHMLQGEVLASNISNPLIWQQCKVAGNQGVIALLPSYGYKSAWLPGKHSVSMFATDGIYLLSFNTKGECTGSSLISSRKIPDARHATTTDEGAVFADINGEICTLKGANIKATGYTVPNINAIGFSSRYKEIWIESSNFFLILENSGTCYRRIQEGQTIETLNGHFILRDGKAIYNPQMETAAIKDIEYTTAPIEIPFDKRADAVIWNVYSSKINLLLTVYAENGRSCHGEKISTLKIRGGLYAPFYHKLVAPPTRTIRLSITGRLPTGTPIGDAVIYLK